MSFLSLFVTRKLSTEALHTLASNAELMKYNVQNRFLMTSIM